MAFMPDITILIPAAGGSRRMGVPKQLLPWGDTTLLGHAIETARNVKGADTLVVLGARDTHIQKEIDAYLVPTVINRQWQHGLGTSIALGIQYIVENASETRGVLIFLADQPFVSTAYLEQLIKKFKSGKQQIITTAYSSEKMGVPALFDACYFKELSELTGDKGAKAVIDSHSEKVIKMDTEVDLRDIDTLAVYKELYKEVFG